MPQRGIVTSCSTRLPVVGIGVAANFRICRLPVHDSQNMKTRKEANQKRRSMVITLSSAVKADKTVSSRRTERASKLPVV
jgi:hypothetical protein